MMSSRARRSARMMAGVVSWGDSEGWPRAGRAASQAEMTMARAALDIRVSCDSSDS